MREQNFDMDRGYNSQVAYERQHEYGDQRRRDRNDRHRDSRHYDPRRHDKERHHFRDRDRERDHYRERASPHGGRYQEREFDKTFINFGGYKIDFANRPSLFDIPPPGYEKTTPLEFKELKAQGALPVMAVPQGSTIVLNARRLMVENLPTKTDPNELLKFLNEQCVERGVAIKPKDPLLEVDFGFEDKSSAYLEFRSAEETSNGLALSGIMYKDVELKISRPPDAQTNTAFYYGCSTVYQDTLNKLFVACIPVYLTDDQVRELLSAFGELKAFNLVKDGCSGLSKGYAFCEYRDPNATDIAISGLNGMQIADKKLVVQRAVLGSRQGTNLGGVIPSQMQVPGIDPEQLIVADSNETEVLCLLNLVTEEELKDDDEYREIVEDIKNECSNFGEIVSMQVPRPGTDARPDSVGKVYIQYATKDMSRQAYEALAGRKFGDNMVITTFYDVEKYKQGEF